MHDCDCHLPEIGKESLNDIETFISREKEKSWSDDFDILIEDCRVVHVYDTEQYKKIKEFIRERIEGNSPSFAIEYGKREYERGFNRACMLYQQPPLSNDGDEKGVE